MAKKSWPVIKKRVYPNGSIGWTADCRINGVGERLTFKTRAEAETAAEQARVKRVNEGQSAFAMLASDRADAEAALAALRPHKRTLREAVAFYIKHLPVIRAEKPIGEIVEELLASKAQDGASRRYLQSLGSTLRMFAAAFSAYKPSDFTSAVVDEWLRGLKVAPTTRNQTRRLLSVLFNFAVRSKYCLSTPMGDTSEAKEIDRRPGILSVAQAAKLLESAEPEILPAVALGMFAGLRPESEILRLDWSHLDFESGLIDIAADRTKTAQHRFVKISDNLAQWLQPYRQPSGRIAPKKTSYLEALRRARTAAGIKHWPGDCLRHTFASMHFAAFKNAGETAQELGHTGLKMLFAHYRERVKPAEAAKFWEIRPAEQGQGKVVPMVA